MEYGLILTGAYIGSEIRSGKNNDGSTYSRQVVAVAVGVDAYKVNVNDTTDLSSFALGDPISFRVRPYAGRNGIGYYGDLTEQI